MKTLYLDIETAPAKAYIWDLKTRYVPINQICEDGYILCLSTAWEGDKHIEFMSLWDNGHDAMIKHAHKCLDEADAVIHFNGSGFDIPRLNTDFLIDRLGPPSPSAQIDLYRTVSNNFRVLSKSMKHMLYLLGLESKLEHKGMELWKGCMKGNKDDQKTMMEYNIQDVRVMEELYTLLRPWIKGHPNRGLFMPEGDQHICPSCGSTSLRHKGYKRTKTREYRQYKCNDCGRYSSETTCEKPTRKDILT